MKKSLLPSLAARLTLLLVALLACVGTASAEGSIESPYVLTLGKARRVFPRNTNNYYQFTPETDMKLKIGVGGNYAIPYGTDATFTTPLSYTEYTTFTTGTTSAKSNEGYISMWVKGGTTYYFAILNNAQTSQIRILQAETSGIAVVPSASKPAIGGTFDLTNSSKATIALDAYINKDEIEGTISGGTKTESLELTSASGYAVGFSARAIVYGWLADGTIQEGDSITVTLTGVQQKNDETIKGGTDGTITVKYAVPKKPVALKKATLPEEILSYWLPTDEKGKITMEFDGDMYAGEKDSLKAYATLSCGLREYDGKFYVDTIPANVDGSTLTFDLSGKLRQLQTYIGYATEKGYSGVVAIKISNLRSADGQFIYVEQQGHNGSYSYSRTFKDITADVVSEWTPADGSYIDGLDNIELWVSPVNAANISAFNVEYINSTDAKKTLSITAADVTTEEVDGGVAYTIPLPAALKGKAVNIKVTPEVAYLDGAEHEEIAATFNPVALKILSPSVTELDSIHSDVDSIEVEIDQTIKSKIGVVHYSIKNVTTGETLKKGFMNKNTVTVTDAGWRQAIVGNYALLKDNEYLLEVRAYMADSKISSKTPLAADTIYIKGTALPYQYSDVTLTEITPDPDAFVVEQPEDAVFTVSFSGAVKLEASTTNINTGNGSSYAFDAITPMDAAEGSDYAKTWQLSAQQFVKLMGTGAPVQFSVVAIDENGKRVKGNTGLEDQTYFDYTYESTYGVPALTFDPANGTTVDSLNVILVGCASGINENAAPSKELVVLNEAGETVAYAASVEPVIPESQKSNMDYNPVQVKVTLNTPVVKAGTYRFVSPAKHFVVGTGMLNYNSASAVDTIIVSGNGDKTLYPLTITPDTTSADGTVEVVHKQVSKIVITYDQAIKLDPEAGDVWVVQRPKTSFANTYAVGEDGKSLVITLTEPIEAEANYKYVIVEVPAGLVTSTDGEYKNAATNFFLTVGFAASTEAIFTADPASGSTVEKIESVTLTFTEEQYANAGYDSDIVGYVVNEKGEEVATFNCYRLDMGAQNNQLVWSLKEAITAPGTYTITFPSGIILMNEQADRKIDEFTITYTISKPTGIQGIIAAEGEADIYTVGGQKVQKAGKGLYIINGKKVAVK